MFADELLVRRNVDAVNPVLSHVAVNPLNLGSEVLENSTRLLRYRLKLLGCEISCAWKVTFNHIFWHSILLYVMGKLHSRRQFACSCHIKQERAMTGVFNDTGKVRFQGCVAFVTSESFAVWCELGHDLRK